MSFYETLYIVDSNLENKTLEKTMIEIGKELEKTNSKIINHRIWGKKRLAYPIDRQKYGSYILLEYEGGEQNKMQEYNTWMKLNNSVLRHMTIVLNDQPEVYVEETKPELVNDSKENLNQVNTKENVISAKPEDDETINKVNEDEVHKEEKSESENVTQEKEKE